MCIDQNNILTVTITPKLMERMPILAQCFEKYGVVSTIGYNVMAFTCNQNNPLASIMKLMRDDVQNAALAAQRDVLAKKIEMVSNKVSGVKTGLFSRGVKKFRASVDFLNKMVLNQNKELGR